MNLRTPELGLENLADRRFCRKLIAFYKIVNRKAPQCLIDYLTTQDLRKRPTIYPLDARAECYSNFFFLTVSHNGATWIAV